MKAAVAFLCGLIFGLGLLVSDMVNPLKVLGFLNIFGNWDASLLFTIGGAIVVTAIGYRAAFRMKKPILDREFHLPDNDEVTVRLLLGASLFGIGWGLVGFCPGPAIVSIGFLKWQVAVFVIAMIAGMAIVRFWQNKSNSKASHVPTLSA